MSPKCAGCASPSEGLFIAGCRACSIRCLARGPLYFAAAQAGKLTREYRQALLVLGSDAAAVHAEVKAQAEVLAGKAAQA